MNTFDVIIPIPASVTKQEGVLPLGTVKNCFISCEYPVIKREFDLLKKFFQLDWTLTDTPAASIVIRENKALGDEAWSITVNSEQLLIEGGDKRGVIYAFSAFAQMVAAALLRGDMAAATLNCGVVNDNPRFPWRSFMLDCARHFQSKETVKKVIRILAHMNINKLHIHLTDDQGWRFASETAPLMTPDGKWSYGQFSAADLREIVTYAQDYGMEIVPEIDVPGHSKALLDKYPQYACDPSNPGREFCLGNPDGRKFLKKLLAEVMDIFKDSNYIHLGGDEAELGHWEKCPKCRKAMQNGGYKSLRELESRFMLDTIDFVKGYGKTPILWGNACSEQIYPADTVIQAWFNIQELGRILNDGNKMIFSVQHSLYFDFPGNNSEPMANWMFNLNDEAVYRTEPYVAWEAELKNNNLLLGTEACLWTEYVPEWRVLQKIISRIFAYSECAWSMPERKNFYTFLERKDVLETAGYHYYLRTLPEFK